MAAPVGRKEDERPRPSGDGMKKRTGQVICPVLMIFWLLG